MRICKARNICGLRLREGIFSDGFSVLTAKTDSKRVDVRIVFRVGSLDDGDAAGVSHFLEHMLFEGPAKDGIHPAIRHLGVRGVVGNAYTNLDATDYRLSGSAADFEAMAQAVFDIAFRTKIDARVVELEKEPIVQELLAAKSEERFRHWAYRQIYPDCPPMSRSTCGTPHSVRAMDVETLQEHQARHYVPHNAALIVIGGVPNDEVFKLAEKLHLPGADRYPAKARASLVPSLPRMTYRRRAEVERLVMFFPHGAKAEEREDAEFVADLLTDGGLGILHQELRIKRRIVYGIDCGVYPMPARRIEFAIPCPADRFDQIERICRIGIDSVRLGNYSDELLETVRAQRLVNIHLQREEDTVLHSALEKTHSVVDAVEERWLEGELNESAAPGLCKWMSRERISRAAERYMSEYGCIRVMRK